MASPAATFDERNRQGKALESYERQKRNWAKLESNLAQKVGKTDPSRTLPGSIHGFRQRQEELGMIDASVPAEIKNGISAWEMNLRSSSGVGGVRYVQVGSSYPYPLYCPIRDSEAVKPDNHILMRVIPDSQPARDKPVSESEYYKTKQTEFKKHVKRKFSHFVSDPQPLHVIGAPPATTQVQIREDPNIDPVVFFPYEEKVVDEEARPDTAESNRSSLAPSADPGYIDTAKSRDQSRPLSAVSQSSEVPPQTGQEGPMLMFSAAHLSFTTSPNVAAHATLRVSNVGSTAVFYSWAPLVDPISEEKKRAIEGATGSAGDTIGTEASVAPTQSTSGSLVSDGSLFRLSAPNDGVFLPDEDSCFTFMFRSATPGAFMQQYELLTVPAGKERIIVQLRGVVFRNDSDAIGVSKLEAAMTQRSMKEDLHNLLGELLTKPTENPLDEAHMRMLVAERNQEKEVIVNLEAELQEKRLQMWTSRNAALNLPFNEEVYEHLHRLHAQYHKLMQLITAEEEGENAVVDANGERITPTPVDNNHQHRPPSVARTETPSQLPSASATLTEKPSMVGTLNGTLSGTGLPPAPAADAFEISGEDGEAIEPVQDWNGSVRSFLEDLTTAKDVQVRTSYLNTLHTLLNAAGVAKDPHEPLKELLMRASANQAWSEAIDDIACANASAKDIAEGRGVLKTGAGAKKDEKGKGAAKKPAASGKGDKGGAAPVERSIEDSEEAKKEYNDLFFTMSRRCVGDLVENMLTWNENANSTISTLCDRDTSVMLQWRMKDIKAKAKQPDAELEAIPDPNAKGGKKK